MADSDLEVALKREEARNRRADTVVKLFGIVATVAAGISGAFFSWAQMQKSNLDFNKSVSDGCVASYRSLMEFADKTTKKDSEIKGAFATLLSGCYTEADIDQILILAKKNEGAILPVPKSGDFIPEKWVAIGFPPKDFNFSPKGSAVLSNLKNGDVIVANTEVYVRKGVANWTNPLGVKNVGEEATVITTRSVAAGKLTQIWAQIK